MRSMTPKALLLGAAVGFALAILPASCGKPPVISRCNASNCDGCCDDTGSCFKGTSPEACGSAAATCSVCAGGQQCARLDVNSEFGGRCTGGTVGDAGTGGGTGTGGGGGSTGGGTGTGGGATGGGSADAGGSCNSTNCANGCCTAAGVCITNTTPARCGRGGGACSACTMGNTCVSGACTPCTGCVDINTGACQAGMSNTQCGKMGGFCQSCDSTAGQTCQGGTCFGGNVCNPTMCPDGCCDGNTCKPRTGYSNAQCGQGAGGAACIQCMGGATCDAADAGACVGGGSSGGDGGFTFPGLDGGFPGGFCDATTPCASGECCAELLPGSGLALCQPVGSDGLIGKVCGAGGGMCAECISLPPFVNQTCNTSTGMCQ